MQIHRSIRVGIGVVALAVIASASPSKPTFRKTAYVGTDPSPALKTQKNVFFDNNWLPTNVYSLIQLQCGNVVEGPAIIEGVDTTVVVPDDQKITMDEYGNLVMEQL